MEAASQMHGLSQPFVAAEGPSHAASEGLKEFSMAKKERGQIVETATEARQAEPGPSVLTLLIISTGLAIIILGVVWFVFFRT